MNAIDKFDNIYAKIHHQHSDDSPHKSVTGPLLNYDYDYDYGDNTANNHQLQYSQSYSSQYSDNSKGYYPKKRPQPIQAYQGSQNNLHNAPQSQQVLSSPYFSTSQYSIHDAGHTHHSSHTRSALQQMGQSSPNIFFTPNHPQNNIHHTHKTSNDIPYHNSHRHSNPPKQYQGVIGSNGGRNTPSTTPPTPLKQHVKQSPANLHGYHHQYHQQQVQQQQPQQPDGYLLNCQPQQLTQSITLPASGLFNLQFPISNSINYKYNIIFSIFLYI